jgi:hypothetical protein
MKREDRKWIDAAKRLSLFLYISSKLYYKYNILLFF